MPFRVEAGRSDGPKRKPGGRPTDPREWTVRHVYLDEVAVVRGGAGAASIGAEADLDERVLEQLIVCGHLKRQRRGPGRV